MGGRIPLEPPKRTKTQAEKKREVKEDRTLRKQHHWKSGHDPADDDAHPDSGWEYTKLVEEEQRPQGPKVTGTMGPEAGMPCFQDGCNNPMRVIQGFEVEEILGYLEGVDLVIPKVEDRVMMLACTGRETHYIQMRESLLPVKTRLGIA